MIGSRAWPVVAGGLALTLLACGGRAKQLQGAATSGSAGSDPTGASGASGAGGVANAGGTSSGRATTDEPPPPVDPEVSRAWTWHACGSLLPEGADKGALFDEAGQVVVLAESKVRVYRANGEATLLSEDDGADFLVESSDGSVLAGRTTPTGISLTPIGKSAPTYTLPRAPVADCGASFTLSADDEYLLATGSGGRSCAWRLADSSFAGSIVGGQAAIHDGGFVAFEDSASGLEVVRRSFDGQELSRHALERNNATLSPTGDRAIVGETLVNLDTLEVVAWDRPPNNPQLRPSVFSPRGETVWVGDGIFRTSDGKRQLDVTDGSPLSREYPDWATLSADGRQLVTSGIGRARLFDVRDGQAKAVLGPLLRPEIGRGGHTSDLALSADGSLLLQNIEEFLASGIAVAPSFGDSKVLWQNRVELNLSVEVSRDGQTAAVGGDGHILISGQDGHLIWESSPPPANVPPLADLCLLDRLRIAPRGTWIAGSAYSGALQIFALGSPPAAAAWQPLVEFPGRCEAAAFSRSEKLMATSAASLYSTGPRPADWKQVWSVPLPDTETQDGFATRDARFSPDETQLLVSRCRQGTDCANTLLSVATGKVVRQLSELIGPHPDFSPEGSWVVAAGKLLHLASGDVRDLDSNGTAIGRAIFAPNGDIIGGADDGSLTRYCRAE